MIHTYYNGILRYYISVFGFTLQLQQLKEHSSLEVGMVVLTLLQLLATTTLDGADWMTYNQLDELIVQSSMAIKFTWLVDFMHSESKTFTFCLFLCTFKVYGNLERR